VEEALEMSLKSLGLVYVDLSWVHWFVGMKTNGRFMSLFFFFWGNGDGKWGGKGYGETNGV
jgi:diketogulonate reductase-like aldo/keto reductase